MNSLKEFGYWVFGVPYPEFLYNDFREDYVASYIHGWSDQHFVLLGMKTPIRLPMGELKTAPDVKYAVDISKYNPIKKKFFIYAVNKTYRQFVGNESGKYRRRRILTYN